MKHSIRQAAIAVTLIALGGSALADTDKAIDGPLDPGKDGLIFCSAPNTKQKTCESAATYDFLSNGKIATQTRLLVSLKPRIEMRVQSIIYEKGKEICGPILKEDIDSATFLIEGSPAPENANIQLRSIVGDNMFAATLGQTICVTYWKTQTGLAMKSNVNGKMVTLPYSWVRPEAGYNLGITRGPQ